MRRTIVFIAGIIISISPLLTTVDHAAVINAASCSQSHVQAAINSANSGDTVSVPAGSVIWTSAVTIPDAKKVTLQGAGSNSTIIIVNLTRGEAINAGFSKSRITGICFNLSGSANAINIKGSEWRIDHCKFNSSGTSGLCSGVAANGTSTNWVLNGLVDSCEFINSRVIVSADLSLLAHGVWAQPLGLGTAEAVYVEDCTFTYTKKLGDCIDANYGGAYVFRYNTVNDSTAYAHSVQGNHRATRKWEIYNNTFNQINYPMWCPIHLCAGTGVVFNNVITGTWTLPKIALANIRSCYTKDVSGLCDGSSPWDGNETGKAGYPCRDQIGRSTDQWLWTKENQYPPQALDPAYAWNNKYGDNDVDFIQHDCPETAVHIQLGRDYFNNVKKPGYTPFTYPHPLRGSETRTKPFAPTDLKISQ